MSDISSLSSVFKPSGSPSSGNKSGQQGSDWAGKVGVQSKGTQSTQQTLQGISFDRAPKGTVTNQNGELSPEQMAKFLSQELTKRKGRQKSRKKRKRSGLGIEDSLSEILEENEDLTSLLNGASPEAIAEFLAFFQDEIERHLSGVSFGAISYNSEIIEMLSAY